MLVKETIRISGVEADAAAREGDEREKAVIFKSCTPFTDFIIEINNIQVDNSKDLDVVMPMYNI